MGAYVKSYGIQPDTVCLKEKLDAVILSYIKEHEVDLLVLGAYGKPGVMNFFSGSATKALIEKANIPLFLYH